MILELYDALKDAGASEEKAQAAAKAIADYDSRFSRIEADMVNDQAATKKDIHELEMRLTIRMAVMFSAFAGLIIGGIGLMLKFTLH
jgi:hypothetical protein